MKSFQNYAPFYDAFYQKKNYQKESKFLESFFPKNSIKLLDLGMGTGGHFIYFLNKNYEVHGVELSSKMINLVKKKIKIKKNNKFKLHNKNILKFVSKKNKFDVAYSMFHVVNYLKSKKELKIFFHNVYNSLSKGGVFIFDIWNHDLISHEKLKNSIKQVKLKKFVIQRFGNIEKLKRKNIFVNITYDFKVFKNKKLISEFTEPHKLCVFKKKDIIISAKNKFKIINFSKWFNKKRLPGKKNFSSFYVLKKI